MYTSFSNTPNFHGILKLVDVTEIIIQQQEYFPFTFGD